VICGTVKFGDDSEVAIEGSGTILFEAKTGEHLPLTGVYYIPRLTTDIISLGQLDEGGCNIHVRHSILQIHVDKGQLIVLSSVLGESHVPAAGEDWATPLPRGMSVMGIFTPMPCPSRSIVGWCKAFPMSNTSSALRQLHHHQAEAGPLPITGEAAGLLDLVYGDLCGPIKPSTPRGKKYFLLLVDDKSRYMCAALLTADTLAALKKFQANVKVETGR
jgi:hypothetical protein